MRTIPTQTIPITFGAAGLRLEGQLSRPPAAKGLVIFAHGSGSSRFSPRNQSVATALQEAGFATLLFDLLTEAEAQDRANVFDIGLLGGRVALAVQWARANPATKDLAIGLFGASTGAAAALRVAADMPDAISAVVSRGGRPDLAGAALPAVRAATLLIVGGHDEDVLALNKDAARQLVCETALKIVPGATHLFEEPGALDSVTRLAAEWFREHLVAKEPSP